MLIPLRDITRELLEKQQSRLTDEDLMEVYGKTRAEIEELRDEMAYRYRKYRDYHDESWIGDRDEAIRYELMENK